MTVRKLPELLAPAGDPEKLRAAIAFGADAVYLAGKAYGMRSNAGNFLPDELTDAIRTAHAAGVKVYVTVNTMPRNDELAALPEYLAFLSRAGADAVIVADPGVAAMARKFAPDVPMHVSTQACVTNYAAALAWRELGASRIVLARELTLPEIAEIRARIPAELELECFVHGAMCVAYSGRCLLSSALMGRDASRGMCTQPCRWSYSLVEEKRPGIYIPVEEAEGESYVFNSCDLRMIEHIPALAAAGIDSLKIEGRGKTAYYAAAITNAYRLALDGYAREGDGWTCSPELLSETEKLSHRPYDTGFFFGKHDLQSRRSGDYIRPWDLAALQLSCEGQTAVLRQKNHFAPGDRLEWLIPRTMPRPATLLSLEDEEGTPLDAARHPLQTVRARFAEEVPEGAILRKMIQNP